MQTQRNEIQDEFGNVVVVEQTCPNSPTNMWQLFTYQYTMYMRTGVDSVVAAAYIERQINDNLTATFIDCVFTSNVTALEFSQVSTAPIDGVLDYNCTAPMDDADCYRVNGGFTMRLKSENATLGQNPESLVEDEEVANLIDPHLINLFDSGLLQQPFEEDIVGLDYFTGLLNLGEFPTPEPIETDTTRQVDSAGNVIAIEQKCPTPIPEGSRPAPQILGYQYELYLAFDRDPNVAIAFLERQIQRELSDRYLDCVYNEDDLFDFSGFSSAPVDKLIDGGCSGIEGGTQCFRVDGGITADIFYTPFGRNLQLKEIVDFRVVNYMGSVMEEMFESGELRGQYTDDILGMNFKGFTNIAGGSDSTYAAGEDPPDVAAVEGRFIGGPDDGSRLPVILSSIAVAIAAIVLCVVLGIAIRRRREYHCGGDDEREVTKSMPTSRKQSRLNRSRGVDTKTFAQSDEEAEQYIMEPDYYIDDEEEPSSPIQVLSDDRSTDQVYTNYPPEYEMDEPRFIPAQTPQSITDLSQITPDRSYEVSDTVNL